MAKLIDMPLGQGEIWNVNFPGCELEECKGVLWDRTVSMDVFYNDSYNETKLADGRVSYMVEGKRNWEATEGTDLRAILDNYVSVGKARNIS